MHNIKLYLNKFQWSWLSEQLRQVAEIAPVKDYEIESCLLAEMYDSRLHSFTFYKPGDMGMKFKFTQSEAYALHNYFSDHDNAYNTFIRMFIEPKLIAGKSYEPRALSHEQNT